MKKLLKSVIFVVIIVFILNSVSSILRGDDPNAGNTRGMTLAYNHKNFYDVLFLGSSVVSCNINNQEMYEKYGIAALNLTSPEQTGILSYFTLKEALTIQKPTVVICDTKELSISDTELRGRMLSRDKYTIRIAATQLRNPFVKLELIKWIQDRNWPENDNFSAIKWNYISNIYCYHDNWKNLKDYNFDGFNKSYFMNGTYISPYINLSIGDKYTESEEDDANDKDIFIKSGATDYITKMNELCKKKGIKFIVTSSYIQESKTTSKMFKEFCEKNNIPFLDINEHREEIGFNIKEDLNDDVHFNLFGSVKWGNYLGKYLKDNFSLPDRRNDKRYSIYEDQREIFANQKEFMQDSLKLKGPLKYKDYLKKLKELDVQNNVIMVKFQGDAVNSIDQEGHDLFKDIGLNIDNVNSGDGYVAIISSNGIQQKASSSKDVSVETIINNVSYTCNSRPKDYYNGEYSIKVDDVEWGEDSTGMSIVVYNTKQKFIVSNAYFPTHGNPDFEFTYPPL